MRRSTKEFQPLKRCWVKRWGRSASCSRIWVLCLPGIPRAFCVCICLRNAAHLFSRDAFTAISPAARRPCAGPMRPGDNAIMIEFFRPDQANIGLLQSYNDSTYVAVHSYNKTVDGRNAALVRRLISRSLMHNTPRLCVTEAALVRNNIDRTDSGVNGIVRSVHSAGGISHWDGAAFVLEYGHWTVRLRRLGRLVPGVR